MRPSIPLDAINNTLPKKLSVKQAQERSDGPRLVFDPNARRVIAPLGKDDANYYALVEQDPDTKLCRGVHIDIEEVYFFVEFRYDDNQSREARRHKCGDLV